jgi:hypothetical protein
MKRTLFTFVALLLAVPAAMKAADMVIRIEAARLVADVEIEKRDIGPDGLFPGDLALLHRVGPAADIDGVSRSSSILGPLYRRKRLFLRSGIVVAARGRDEESGGVKAGAGRQKRRRQEPGQNGGSDAAGLGARRRVVVAIHGS